MRNLFLAVVLFALVGPAHAQGSRPGEGTVLTVRLQSDHEASVSWRVFGAFRRARVLRTVSPIDEDDLHRARYPVVELESSQANAGGGVDNALAHGILYHYWLEVDRADGTHFYAKADLDVPNRPLPDEISDLTLLVDKTHYFLEVRDHGDMVKRYPIALGADPVSRKLYQDSACTPEGVYRIRGLQKKASYHRAIDIDYPNMRDKLRFNVGTRLGLIPRGHSIGGDIQIHGDVLKEVAVFANWTRGCIAMRNADIDELFDRPELARGTFVFILGNSLSYDDLESVLSSWGADEVSRFQHILSALSIHPVGAEGTVDAGLMQALGVYQKMRGLPFTCELDTRTVNALRAERFAEGPSQGVARYRLLRERSNSQLPARNAKARRACDASSSGAPESELVTTISPPEVT